MKKYKVTDKHPELKEGIELKKAISDNFVYCHIGSIEHGFNAEEEWVKKGWIREIQEPKWTDQDMIDWLYFCYNKIGPTFDYKLQFEKWQNDRNK